MRSLSVNAEGFAEIFNLRTQSKEEKYNLAEIEDAHSFFLDQLSQKNDGQDLCWDKFAYISADTTHNCNLRCPFCVDDFSTATKARMSEETFRKVVGMTDLVGNGGMFLSCLYEPFLHPKFSTFLDVVPETGRSKCFFTTNLCVKRFSEEVLLSIANANVNYINISVDSLRRDVYERLRKNADYDVFMTNLLRLAAIMRRGPAKPRLRFITVVLKSNYKEVPDMVRISAELFGVAEHEIRAPFSMPYAPAGWEAEETIGSDEWMWLEDVTTKLGYSLKVMPDTQTARFYGARPADLFT